MALGMPRWAALRRRKAPRALLERWRDWAATRSAVAARLAVGLVRRLSTLPPLTRLLGARPSQAPKCLALGQRAMSRPVSLMIFRTEWAPSPSIAVRSTPA